MKLLCSLARDSASLWRRFSYAQTQFTANGWRNDVIYRIGGSKGALDIGSYALGQGLYDADGTWVADVGLAWNYASWFTRSMASGTIPEALTGPFANLQSLEVALRRHEDRAKEALNAT